MSGLMEAMFGRREFDFLEELAKHTATGVTMRIHKGGKNQWISVFTIRGEIHALESHAFETLKVEILGVLAKAKRVEALEQECNARPAPEYAI